MATTTTAIPQRSQIPAADRWDLGKLFPAEEAWEQGLEEYEKMVPRIAAFKGTLGESAAGLLACLEFLNELEMLDERVGYYAMLRTSEDAGDSDNQGRFARYLNVASRAE
ncbi:MAG: oligoendopeptidase F, partial [Gammaproteobacteria bacterium]|nr:oligoendopeptidase F [Gammaproteobacteria bacterium]